MSDVYVIREGKKKGCGRYAGIGEWVPTTKAAKRFLGWIERAKAVEQAKRVGARVVRLVPR